MNQPNGTGASYPQLKRLMEGPREVKFYHHRLDLDPPNSMCKHFAFPATLEAGSVYLTPHAFTDPRYAY